MLSIIIPHLNQPEQLGACLTSLMEQAAAEGHKTEIIVVDNGSRDMPEAVVAGFEGVRLVQETTPGPGPARNHGVALSTGEILAFIDADCLAGAGWFQAIAGHFAAHPEAVILGGDVRIACDAPDALTPLEAYESIYAYRMKEYIAKQGFTGTGNLAIRREVFEDVGPFGGLHIAEDRDWGQRALAKGYKTTYVDHMKVYHPARKSFGELVQKWNRHIAHDYEKIGKKPGGRLRWLGRSVAVLGSPVFELGRILTSDRISGMNDRLKALGILLRIRLYRGGQMLRVLTASDPQAESSGWNRG